MSHTFNGGVFGSNRRGIDTVSSLSERAEYVTLAQSPQVTARNRPQWMDTHATEGVTVGYGNGNARILEVPTQGGSRINVLKAGIYDVLWEASVDVGGARSVPELEFHRSAATDFNNPVAQLQGFYIRSTGNNVKVCASGNIIIPENNYDIRLAIASTGAAGDAPNLTVDVGSKLYFMKTIAA